MEEIQRIGRATLDIDRSIRREDRLIEDLQLDSLGMIALAVGLEDRFRVKLHEEDGQALRTAGDLARLVARRILEEGRQP